MSKTDTEGLLAATEDWFVRIGIPHFIEDFTASEDVWTRAVGFLSLVFVGELFLTFGSDFNGWYQAGVFVVGLAVMVGAVIALNKYRGRSDFARPDDIGIAELALFVLVPPFLAILGGHNTRAEFVGVVVLNLAILLVVYTVVSWGLFAMARWGLAAMWSHLTQVAQLLGSILPLMLLFSAFLFLNAEIWQVVNDFPVVLFAIVVGSLGAIALVFLTGAMSGSIQGLRFFKHWDEVCDALASTPLKDCDTSAFPGTPEHVPLGRAARFNLTLRLVVGLAVQVLLVTLLIFGFYVVFGMLTVREDTMLQWTTLEAGTPELQNVTLLTFGLAGHEVILTTLHLVASGFVAAFSGLQFAVSLVTDESYTEAFVEDSNAEMREALAVRAAYLELAKAV